VDTSQRPLRRPYYKGELNAIHPFREGNGRTQREFIRQLADRNGYSIDWSRASRDEMSGASKNSSQRGDNTGLEQSLQMTLAWGER
jgi:cell filamentation protein